MAEYREHDSSCKYSMPVFIYFASPILRKIFVKIFVTVLRTPEFEVSVL